MCKTDVKKLLTRDWNKKEKKKRRQKTQARHEEHEGGGRGGGEVMEEEEEGVMRVMAGVMAGEARGKKVNAHQNHSFSECS